MWFSVCRRYAPARNLEGMRVLVVEDEPYMAGAIRDGLRLEAIAARRWAPFRREVSRDGRYIALTRKQFAVLEVLVAAEGGIISAEELLERAWDENADPFTNAVRITVSALRKRLGEPWVIATVPGVGYRIDTPPGTGQGGENDG